MNANNGTPVIIIIHGAWHRSSQWYPIAIKLQDLGYVVECPQLKTCRGEIPPVTSLEDDIAEIRGIAMSYIQQGREIIVIMHSYGGIVGTNALSGLGKTDIRGPDMPGYVRGLIYACAFIPMENTSLESVFEQGLPPWILFGDDGVLRVENAEHHFYNDLSPGEQRKQTSQLVVHPIIAQVEGTKAMERAAAWRSTAVTYLFCDNDQALLPSVQEAMVLRVEDAGVVVKRRRCNSGHSPFLSSPDSILEAVLEV